MNRNERLGLAKRRILKVLRAHRVCSLRTLENKISDAGPYGMRINPHLMTQALHQLEQSGSQVKRVPTGWGKLSR